MENPVVRLGEKSITRILQAQELRMLKQVKILFEKNDITFYLACGTALGCARHKGFIPWDDDIDIYIRGKDLKKVKELFLTQNTGNLLFQDYSTVEGYPYTFPKIIDGQTLLIEQSLKHLNYTCGVYIDVFPIFGITNSRVKRVVKEKIRYFRYAILKAYYFNYSKGLRGKLNTIARALIDPLKVQKKLYNTYIRDRDDSEFLIDPGVFGKDAILRAKAFKETIYMKFEDDLMPMPLGYEEYLTDYYGDYRQLPPIDQRITKHHIGQLEIPGVKELED